MNYSQFISSISRIPCSICVVTLDFCANTFGNAPCTAVGTQCFNTWQTCKCRTAYSLTSKKYKFRSADTPTPTIPVNQGAWGYSPQWGTNDSSSWGKDGSFIGNEPWATASPRPYLLSYKLLPTDITGDITITARATVVMTDEPDNDAGIDPYRISRGTIPISSFWKKLIARNPNYKNRYIQIYDGFLGMQETDFTQRFIGKIDSIAISGSQVTISATDILLTLDSFTIPPNSQVQLVSAIGTGDTSIVLSSLLDANGINLFPNSNGYIRIGDEIISYSSINISQNTLTGCTRGAYGTVAAAGAQNAKVQPCKFYQGNPFDILQSMLLNDANIPAQYVNSASFNYWKNYPQTDINFDALISEPTSLKTLFWEIINVMDLKCWVAEDLTVTVSRGMQNVPGTTYTYLTDAVNIIYQSSSVDTNDASAITRATIFYNQLPIAKADQTAAYQRAITSINGESESPNGYGIIIEQRFLSRWISSRYQDGATIAAWVSQQALHMIYKYADTQPIITFDVEMKDQDIKTGQYVKISTDELMDRFGNPINAYFLITSRDSSQLNKMTYKAIQCVNRRWGFIGPNTVASDYATASDTDKQFWYLADANGNIGNEKVEYLIY